MATENTLWLQPLADVRLTSIGRTPDGMVVSLETDNRPCRCTLCQSPSTVRYGRMGLRVRDLAFDGERVDLDVKRARMRCNACLKTFNEPVPGVSERHRATERMVTLVAKMALSDSFLSVARQLCLDEKTVRAIFNERLPILSTISRPHSPASVLLWLPHIQGKLRAAWVNPAEGTVIRMDAGASAASLSETVRELAARGTELLALPPEPALIKAVIETGLLQARLHGPALRAACRKQSLPSNAPKPVDDYLQRLRHFVATDTPEEAARHWNTLLEPPPDMRTTMQPLLQAVQMMGPACFNEMQHTDRPSDLEMMRIETLLSSRFGRRSYEVMLAVMLYDKRLFLTRRTPIQSVGVQLAMGYQKINFGTSLAKLGTRLSAMQDEPRAPHKAVHLE
ncbi:MAG: hypothetical protein ACI8WM_003343 [Burkholderiaceae bacterium]|jgi:hypothetical protein